jgi:cell division protein FtsL
MQTMITNLKTISYPFVVILAFVILLATYGSDFSAVAGYMAIITMFYIIFNFYFISYLKNIVVVKILLLLGAASCVLLYKQLHLNFWDESSLYLALLIFTIMVASSVLAHTTEKITKKTLTKTPYSFFIVSVLWGFSFYYPLTIFLFLSVLFVYELLYNKEVTKNIKYEKSNCKYILFLASMELSFVLWDFQEITLWAYHLFLIFLSAGVGVFLQNYYKINKFNNIFLILIIIVSTIYHIWVIHWTHSLCIGLSLGVIWQQSYVRNNNISAISASIFAGFFVGVLFYLRLEILPYKAILILPFLWLLFKKYQKPDNPKKLA